MSDFREERIGDCRLILGDCLEVMPTLGDVDAVVTDPPYGIGFQYNSYDDTKSNLCSLIDDMMPMFRAIAKRVVITPGKYQYLRLPARRLGRRLDMGHDHGARVLGLVAVATHFVLRGRYLAGDK